MSNNHATEVPRIQNLIAVFWPSFLTAGVATVILFTVFDPLEVSSCMGGPQISRLGAYSIGFFIFWLLTSSSCLLSLYFNKPCPSTARRKSDPV